MRPELENFDDYFWGLTKNDFKSTSDLVKSFMKAYWKDLKLPIENNTVTPELDLFIGQHYYETQFLIHFGIWRLQSIFESLLKENFDMKKTNGMRNMIKYLKKKGYTVIKESELSGWTQLRNKLSHSAPEMFPPSPTNLIEKDIDDFSKLLLEIYEDLEIQKVKSGNA